MVFRTVVYVAPPQNGADRGTETRPVDNSTNTDRLTVPNLVDGLRKATVLAWWSAEFAITAAMTMTLLVHPRWGTSSIWENATECRVKSSIRNAVAASTVVMVTQYR
ncbi:MAG TPA: hypothetical protein VIL34_09940 [Actinopolymorphaceae bacterium]